MTNNQHITIDINMQPWIVKNGKSVLAAMRFLGSISARKSVSDLCAQNGYILNSWSDIRYI